MRNASKLLRIGLLFLVGGGFSARSYGQSKWQDIFGPPPDPDANWSKHIRLGALVGFNFKGEFSINGPITVSSSAPGGPGSGQNHTYDDGYVNLDATGNNGNMTWNWGYESANQISGNNLQFHSVQSYNTTGSASVDGDPQVGMDLAYGGRITRMWGGTLGWEFGFGWLPIEINNNLTGSANVNRLVHSYNTLGIILPQAPYQGGYNGPGATISDNAVETTETLSGVPLGGSQTLDVNLYNFRLGPTLQWELHPRIAVAVGAGAAFGIVSGGLKFNETLTFSDGTANNSGEVGDTQFVYGGYVSATLLFHAVQNGDLYLGLQYMPMTSATFSGGGQSGKLDFTGSLYISAGINWPF